MDAAVRWVESYAAYTAPHQQMLVSGDQMGQQNVAISLRVSSGLQKWMRR
jgi:hypothetical protein